MNNRTKFGPVRLSALAGGAFAVTMALAACGGGNDTPEGAVENFFNDGAEDITSAVVDGDFDKAADVAADYFCSDDVESIRSLSEMFADLPEETADAALEEAASQFEDLDDFDFEITDSSEDGDTATVTVEATVDGDTSTDTFDLTKEDDGWKICGKFSM